MTATLALLLMALAPLMTLEDAAESTDIVSFPEDPSSGLLADVGISTHDSALIHALEEFDHGIFALEDYWVAGIQVDLIGVLNREHRMLPADSMLRYRHPRLEAILNQGVVAHATPPIDGHVLHMGSRLPLKRKTISGDINPPDAVDVELSAGASLAALGLYDEAESVLLGAYMNILRLAGRNHSHTRRVAHALVDLYGAWAESDPGKERSLSYYRNRAE